jgi:prepilin-type N-terminal cleavage/methylation domain-containing protein
VRKVGKKKSGFTLVELLVVIGILGILAISLLATLNPLEQLRRARDTSSRNMAEEFYNACLRYNAMKDGFAWTNNAQTAVTLTSVTGNYLQSLLTAGELKESFLNNTGNLAKILFTSTHAGIGGNMDDLAVCFAPESKAIQQEPETKYNASGVVASGCTAVGSTCYWCIK